MNYPSLVFLGIFFSFALSWSGMVLLPQLQIGRQDAAVIEETNQPYPSNRSGMAQQGKEVYRQLGCAACHTQQVRPSDVSRWGKRFTVARDYLRDYPVLLGSQRIGPDLTNVGARKPDAAWHLLHLYNPRIVVQGSPMPRYGFLFKERKINGQKSSEALSFPDGFKPKEGVEIIPSLDALALAAYMQSLHTETSLYESPLPQPKKPAGAETNAVPADTNAPATDTNLPVK